MQYTWDPIVANFDFPVYWMWWMVIITSNFNKFDSCQAVLNNNIPISQFIWRSKRHCLYLWRNGRESFMFPWCVQIITIRKKCLWKFSIARLKIIYKVKFASGKKSLFFYNSPQLKHQVSWSDENWSFFVITHVINCSLK